MPSFRLSSDFIVQKLTTVRCEKYFHLYKPKVIRFATQKTTNHKKKQLENKN